MAYYQFTKAIFENRPIQVFNHGDVARDFTYIDDIVEGVVRCVAHPPAPNPNFLRETPQPGASWAPHRVFNIGNRMSEQIMDMIAILEIEIGRAAVKEFLPMQPGDLQETWADVADPGGDCRLCADNPAR